MAAEVRFCRRCGNQLASDSAFCPRCGASTWGQSAGLPPQAVAPPAHVLLSKKSHAGRNAGIVVAIVILLILVGGFLVPFPHSFSYQAATVSSGGPGATGQQMNFPAGSSVSGSYSADGGFSPTAVVILDANLHSVYVGGALSSGSFSFTASNPPYYFIAVSLLPGFVAVSGTYSSPLF